MKSIIQFTQGSADNIYIKGDIFFDLAAQIILIVRHNSERKTFIFTKEDDPEFPDARRLMKSDIEGWDAYVRFDSEDTADAPTGSYICEAVIILCENNQVLKINGFFFNLNRSITGEVPISTYCGTSVGSGSHEIVSGDCGCGGGIQTGGTPGGVILTSDRTFIPVPTFMPIITGDTDTVELEGDGSEENPLKATALLDDFVKDIDFEITTETTFGTNINSFVKYDEENIMLGVQNRGAILYNVKTKDITDTNYTGSSGSVYVGKNEISGDIFVTGQNNGIKKWNPVTKQFENTLVVTGNANSFATGIGGTFYAFGGNITTFNADGSFDKNIVGVVGNMIQIPFFQGDLKFFVARGGANPGMYLLNDDGSYTKLAAGSFFTNTVKDKNGNIYVANLQGPDYLHKYDETLNIFKPDPDAIGLEVRGLFLNDVGELGLVTAAGLIYTNRSGTFEETGHSLGDLGTYTFTHNIPGGQLLFGAKAYRGSGFDFHLASELAFLGTLPVTPALDLNELTYLIGRYSIASCDTSAKGRVNGSWVSVPTKTELNSKLSDIEEEIEAVRNSMPDTSEFVKLQSDTTQLIDSDLALKNGKKLLVEKEDGTQANAVSVGDYTVTKTISLEDVEVGMNLRGVTVTFDTSKIPTFNGSGVLYTSSTGENIYPNSNLQVSRIPGPGPGEQRPFGLGFNNTGASPSTNIFNANWLVNTITYPDDQDYKVSIYTILVSIDPSSEWTFADTSLEIQSTVEQIEIGSETDYLNLNSSDRPTVETPLGKEEIAYLSDLPTIDYSTEEQWTGKRWIDGKKIYQKTIVYSNPLPSTVAQVDIPHTIQSMGVMVDIAGTSTNDNTGAQISINGGTYSAQVRCYTVITSSVPSIRLWVSSNLSEYTMTYITLQYTCTDR